MLRNLVLCLEKVIFLREFFQETNWNRSEGSGENIQPKPNSLEVYLQQTIGSHLVNRRTRDWCTRDWYNCQCWVKKPKLDMGSFPHLDHFYFFLAVIVIHNSNWNFSTDGLSQGEKTAICIYILQKVLVGSASCSNKNENKQIAHALSSDFDFTSYNSFSVGIAFWNPDLTADCTDGALW